MFETIITIAFGTFVGFTAGYLIWDKEWCKTEERCKSMCDALYEWNKKMCDGLDKRLKPLEEMHFGFVYSKADFIIRPEPLTTTGENSDDQRTSP